MGGASRQTHYNSHSVTSLQSLPWVIWMVTHPNIMESKVTLNGIRNKITHSALYIDTFIPTFMLPSLVLTSLRHRIHHWHCWSGGVLWQPVKSHIPESTTYVASCSSTFTATVCDYVAPRVTWETYVEVYGCCGSKNKCSSHYRLHPYLLDVPKQQTCTRDV